MRLPHDLGRVAGRLGLREALPELKRIARDERVNQNVRYSAMRAVLQLAEPKDAERLLLDLINRKYHSRVRGTAMLMLAQISILNTNTMQPIVLEWLR